jgi:hypothetical protein
MRPPSVGSHSVAAISRPPWPFVSAMNRLAQSGMFARELGTGDRACGRCRHCSALFDSTFRSRQLSQYCSDYISRGFFDCDKNKSTLESRPIPRYQQVAWP